MLLLLAFWRRRSPSPETRRHLVLFGMSVAVCSLYPAAVGGPGPRYLLAYFPFLALAVVDTHRRMRAEDPTRARRISAVLLGVQRLVLLKTGPAARRRAISLATRRTWHRPTR